MYPLQENFIAPIDTFLHTLHNTSGLTVKTNNMSTQVFGEAELVFTTVHSAIIEAYENLEQCPFVLKVLKGDVSSKKIKDYG